ncbi:hypothetical protein [Rubellimicrobium mesophilum]|uniref:hypothetical protein n=1 Tax=Rubellimicrobium mesophilum TaxID=1123067 RepID=UPI0012E199B3|nr:hypothetical protein [Rubellimicrobium mesophilum]
MDIINAPALQKVVEDTLQGGPPALRGYRPAVRACIRRLAAEHRSVKKARLRKSDPEWARAKAEAGHALYRFDEAEVAPLVRTIQRTLGWLGQVAELAGNRHLPLSREAGVFLRGLSHRRDDIMVLGLEARHLVQESEQAVLKADLYAKRLQPLREPAEIKAGDLIGRRCTTIDEIVQLGRRAQNCLSHRNEYWARFAAGESDFWVLQSGDRLAAILEVKCRTRCVAAAEGPDGATISLRDARGVALFCKAAGLEIGQRCEGVMLDFAAPFLVEPRVVEVEGRIMAYAEWPTAFRIDLGPEPGQRTSGHGPASTLALSFDPSRSVATAILEGQDLCRAVESFGREAIRKVVQTVALDQATPTLVQHRLLALAA